MGSRLDNTGGNSLSFETKTISVVSIISFWNFFSPRFSLCFFLSSSAFFLSSSCCIDNSLTSTKKGKEKVMQIVIIKKNFALIILLTINTF